MYDVFLSYARAERLKSVPVLKALQGIGLSVFFDSDGIEGGDQFPKVIDSAIKAAGAVVSLWSPLALTRDWVIRECRVGQLRGNLIPVMIDPFHELEVPAEFVGTQYLDLCSFAGDRRDPNFVLLLRALGRVLKRDDLIRIADRDPVQAQETSRTTSESEQRDVRYTLDIDFLDAVNGSKKRVTLGEDRTIDLVIPRGVESGQVLRLTGLGAVGNGKAGDALLELVVKPHPVFNRVGADIHMDMNISLLEALAGTRLQTPTVTGPVALTIPPGSNSGKILRLKGKGAADGGDLFVRLIIMLPDGSNQELRKVLEKWPSKSTTPPRPE